MDNPADALTGKTGLESGAHTPLLWLVVPLMVGYALGGAFPGQLPPWPVFALTAGLALLAALLASRPGAKRATAAWAAAFMAAVALAGWAYYATRVPAPPDLTRQANREATVVLEVTRVFALRSGGQRIAGLAEIVTPPPYRPDFRGQAVFFHCWTDDASAGACRGAVLRLRGKLEPVPPSTEGFDQYLRQQGCHLKLTQASLRKVVDPGPAWARWCARTNERWQQILQTGADAPRERQLAGIATAMLLGEKSALTTDQKERFIASGTMHLFAVSGLHVGIVGGLLFIVQYWLRVPRKWQAALGLPLLLVYVEITGGAPSAIRAWWMAFFFWTAHALLRKPAPLSALAGSALVVLLIDPRQLGSAGFQLSYTVVGGLLLYGVPLQDWLRHRYEPWRWIPPESLRWWQRWSAAVLRWFWSLLAISFAATVFSAPLTVRYFEVFAPGAFLLNIPLVALAPLAMTASLLAVAGSTVGLSALAAFANHASWVFIASMDGLVRLFLWAPESSLALGWRWPGTGYRLTIALLVAAICLADRRVPAKWRFGLPPALLVLGLVIGATTAQTPLP